MRLNVNFNTALCNLNIFPCCSPSLLLLLSWCCSSAVADVALRHFDVFLLLLFKCQIAHGIVIGLAHAVRSCMHHYAEMMSLKFIIWHKKNNSDSTTEASEVTILFAPKASVLCADVATDSVDLLIWMNVRMRFANTRRSLYSPLFAQWWNLWASECDVWESSEHALVCECLHLF